MPEELKERGLFERLCNRYSTDDIQFITELILADRKKVLEEVRKPLQDMKQTQIDNFGRMGWIRHEEILTKAIDETLSKIKEIMGEV